MYRYYLWLCLPLLLPLSAHSLEARACASSVDEMRLMLGDPVFPLNWEERSMTDGKPLVVSIQEKKGALFLQFIKDKEGLWAESTGVICQVGSELRIEFTDEQIRLGPAANWVLKIALSHGGKFILKRIGPEQLRIATSGWQGLFSPKRQ